MKYETRSVELPVLNSRESRPGRVAKYISPSGYMNWLHCHYQYYLKKLSGHVQDWDDQAIPAAMGSAFDCYAKVWLADQLGFGDHPKVHPFNLSKNVNIKDESLRDEIFAAAQSLTEQYVTRGLAQRLLDEGLHDLELDIIAAIEGVPIYGLPDATVKTKIEGFGEREYPIDFKIRGYKTKNSASPTPGYKTYVSTSGRAMSAHNRSKEHLETLHERWAIQCMMYFWILNPDIPVGSIDIPVGIEEICYQENSICFTQIRTTVSKQFQTMHMQKIKHCWQTMYTPPIPVPSSRMCFMWNRICEVGHHCKYLKNSALYKAMQNA